MMALQVVFYAANGSEVQAFDYSSDQEARDFSSCCFNPSGDTAVVGAFNRFYVYSMNSSRGTWEQVGVKQVRCMVYMLAAPFAATGDDVQASSSASSPPQHLDCTDNPWHNKP
eukprot:GHRQ01018394.1.p2 GENE.GHRQ01018394.1~~GHRQ01018394.1.p2  ORF type:complete len:113 (-),score=45.80 GHRQ01018394.1:379-717(-)